MAGRFSKTGPTIERLEAARADAAEIWQENLLPFVKWCLAGAMIAIFTVLVLMGDRALDAIHNSGGDNEDRLVAQITAVLSSEDERAAERGIIAVEAYRSLRRYDQAQVALITRDGLRLAAFMTGLCLVFVGSLFVIGKFVDTGSIRAEYTVQEAIGFSVATSSPGLLSITLGAVVIITATVWQPRVSAQDGALEAGAGGGLQDEASGADQADPLPRMGGLGGAIERTDGDDIQ